MKLKRDWIPHYKHLSTPRYRNLLRYSRWMNPVEILWQCGNPSFVGRINAKLMPKKGVKFGYEEYAEYASHCAKVLALLNQRDDCGQTPISLSYMIDAMVFKDAEKNSQVSMLTLVLENLVGEAGGMCLNHRDCTNSTVYHMFAKQLLREIVNNEEKVNLGEDGKLERKVSLKWYDEESLDLFYRTVVLWKNAGLDIYAEDISGMTGTEIIEQAVKIMDGRTDEKYWRGLRVRDLVTKLKAL
ncbi:hypothetical protein HK098_003038 [Nowakowskiella sp. JEL0407]|nr:hypothetical protein HK098_003038 [Nowakowskiella sp. JEL0407]